MEDLAFSNIIRMINESIATSKPISLECRCKRTGKIVKVDIQIREDEFFTDKNGIKWKRA